jgi:hypothetical protein
MSIFAQLITASSIIFAQKLISVTYIYGDCVAVATDENPSAATASSHHYIVSCSCFFSNSLSCTTKAAARCRESW